MSHDDKKIKVSVAYTGHDEYSDDFPANIPVGTIKRRAMLSFGIEESAAEKYALQWQGSDLNDQTHIGEIGQSMLNLVLILKHAQEKGSAK